MKYILLVYSAESGWTDAERTECMARSAELCRRLEAKGQFIAASPLQLIASATSVRVHNGRTMITDGPFAETREQLGGFYLVDVSDLDQAIAIAAEIPAASKGTVEIRPIFELDSLPSDMFEQVAAIMGRNG